MARSTTSTTTTQSDASLESFAVSQGIAANGRRAGQTYAVVTMWANGRPTLSKIYADNKTHLLSILDRMYAEVENWAEPTTKATPAPVAAAQPDIAAMMAEIAALKAANATMQPAAPVAAPRTIATTQPVTASPSAQSRLSRISRKN